MKAYVSGPMRNYPDNNFPAFYAAERTLRRRGWDVINPARLDEEDPAPQGMSYSQSRRFYMDRDLNIIISEMFAEFGDTIFTLPGWTQSNGALAEVALAHSLGMRVKMFVEEERK